MFDRPVSGPCNSVVCLNVEFFGSDVIGPVSESVCFFFSNKSDLPESSSRHSSRRVSSGANEEGLTNETLGLSVNKLKEVFLRRGEGLEGRVYVKMPQSKRFSLTPRLCLIERRVILVGGNPVQLFEIIYIPDYVISR